MSETTRINLKIEDLRAAEYNPRKITASRLNDLKNSLRAHPEYLETERIVVNSYPGRENVIISGHARVLAAKELGWTEIPCDVISVPLEDEKSRNVTHNKHWGEFEADPLRTLILENEEAMQNCMPGDEFDKIINSIEEDAEPEEEQVTAIMDGEDPITVLGDVWQLGDHVITCGDSTDQAVYTRIMQGEKASMCFTDPPYNVDMDSSTDRPKFKHRSIEGDHMEIDEWTKFVDLWLANIRANLNGAIYICMSTKEWPSLHAAFISAGFHWSTTILWVKSNFIIGRSDYQRQHEPIMVGRINNDLKESKAEPMLYGWPEGNRHKWNGGRDQGDAWFFKKPSKNPTHPTMKPVELVAKAVSNSTDRGDTVLEPFLGGGSTLIACERLGRKCRGIELSPRFVDACIARWIGHTKNRDITRNGQPYYWEGQVVNLGSIDTAHA